MEKILSLLVGVLIFSSCSKEEEFKMAYPTTFISTKFSGKNIKVYTKYGEIKDSKITTKLIERIKQHITDLETTQIENDISVTYLSPSNVNLTSISSSYDKMLNLHETSEINYWESRDTSFAVTGNNYNSFDFNQNHLKYRPLFEKHFTPSPLTGYSDAIKFKECKYAKPKGDVVYMPFTDHYFISYDEFDETFKYWQANKLTNNSFDSKTYSKLGVRDTLVIQEFNVELHIKN